MSEQEHVSPFYTTIRYHGVEATLRAYSTEPELRWECRDPLIKTRLTLTLLQVERESLDWSAPHLTRAAAEAVIARLGEGEIVKDVPPPPGPPGVIY